MYKLEIEKTSSTKNATSFLQSDFWASFKEKNGWASYHLYVKYQKENVEKNFYFTLLTRCLTSSFFIGYVPMFPNIIEEYGYIELLTAITKAFYKQFKSKLIFVRFDLDLSFRVENALGEASHNDKAKRPHLIFKKANGFKLVKAKTDIQPPDTVILPLETSEDEIMGQFKSKWRYNIRLAEKKGCVIECMAMASDAEIDASIDVFYSLYQTTAKRDGIAIHTKNYYKSLFLLARSYPDVSCRLYVAKYEGMHLATIITIFYRDEATYLYGASSNENRNLMPTYLLQYRAIMDAKAFGCKTYDFYGMPPREDEGHPMAGLYRFKTGFGGKIVHRLGSIDAYRNGWRYGAYSFAEGMRSFYFKHVKKWFKR